MNLTETTDTITIQTLLDEIVSLHNEVAELKEEVARLKSKDTQKRTYSDPLLSWMQKMESRFNALADYLNVKRKYLDKMMLKQFQDTYPDDYGSVTFTGIVHDPVALPLFESMVDGLLNKYDLKLMNRE